LWEFASCISVLIHELWYLQSMLNESTLFTNSKKKEFIGQLDQPQDF